MNFRMYLYVGLAVVLASLSGMIAYLNARLDAASAENKLLETRVNTQETIINNTREDLEELQELESRINDEFRIASNSRRNLERRLDAIDLRRSALENPSELQTILNRDTLWNNRCNEIATGDTITPEDAENQICPELVQ